MKRLQALLAGVMMLMVLGISVGCAAERPALQDLGRSVKMRILVDKVMQPVAGWKTEEWMVKETAEAGFNVFSPRIGYDNMAAVLQVTDWCRQHGLYHQPWMRGVQGVPEDRTLSVGKRMVWANGSEQMLWSPNSDELWAWLASYVIPYAEISARDETLMGVFLDYENYWPGGRGNLYELSYDDVIMGKFAAEKKIELPKLEFKDRQPWLEEKKLHDEFRAFQIAHWRQKCRELRQAVDKHNPKFMFNIYPAPGTMFMLEACYPEWATAQAPLILSDPWTYGRPGRYTTHDKALKGNQEILQRGLAIAKEKNINQIYIGGIDPVVAGADPEFSGKNALMLSGISDGYWIFYEGPVYAKNHPDYFKWFAWANREMEKKNFAAAWQPRETEDPNAFPQLKISGQAPRRQEAREYPLVKLRTSNALLVSATREQPVQITLSSFRIGQNTTSLTWELKDTQWQNLQTGEIEVQKTGQIEVKVPEDGLYILMLEPGANACAVKSSNVPLALMAYPLARLIFGAEKLYFSVPEGLAQFKFNLGGGGGIETVKLTVFDPDGNQAAVGQATAQKNSLEVPVAAGGKAGQVWSLAIEKADSGVLEDVSLGLDKQLPPVLSFFADEVFQVQRQ
jgi:hypothetical protein